MSHLSISVELVRDRLDDLISGKEADLSKLATQTGEGAPADTAGLKAAVADARADLDTWLREPGKPKLDYDQLEGAVAGKLHAVLKGFSVGALDDPGFWAYLATGPFWFFTKWREDPAARKRESYHVYVDGTSNVECVPLRMFLRAQAVEQDGNYDLASAIPSGTDFWRSHILRVKSGSKKDLARAVADQQVSKRLTVGPVREYAKRINRRWTNEVIYALDESDCREIARNERP